MSRSKSFAPLQKQQKFECNLPLLKICFHPKSFALQKSELLICDLWMVVINSEDEKKQYLQQFMAWKRA